MRSMGGRGNKNKNEGKKGQIKYNLMWSRGSGVRKTLYLCRESGLYYVIGVNKFLRKKWDLFGGPSVRPKLLVLFY